MASLYKKMLGSMGAMPVFYQHYKRQEPKSNECHSHGVSEHAIADAEALQKIFEEGQGMMDPHEMMELMMERRQSLKPYPFEKLQNNTAMFKQHQGEVVDGLSLNMMLPLGNQFQLGGQWVLSNTKGAQFEITSQVNNHSGNPNQDPESVQQAVLRYNTDQSASIIGAFHLPFHMQV